MTGQSMRGNGIEVWTIRGGQLARWEAAFNSMHDGQDPAQSLGIL